MTPHVRTALLEWAVRSARGELLGVDWVNTHIAAYGIPFTVRIDESGTARFAHVPMGRVLPPPVVEQAEAHRQSGTPTAFHALAMLSARAAWLTEARPLIWESYSPVPGLLAALVESYGVDVEIHGRDEATLARLAAFLPSWFPNRGRAAAASRLLRDAVRLPDSMRVDGADEGADELMVCRSAEWHALRGTQGGAFTIRDGFVWSPLGRTDVVSEDHLIGWIPGERIPRELLRLIPSWGSLRIHEVATHG